MPEALEVLWVLLIALGSVPTLSFPSHIFHFFALLLVGVIVIIFGIVKVDDGIIVRHQEAIIHVVFIRLSVIIRIYDAHLSLQHY